MVGRLLGALLLLTGISKGLDIHAFERVVVGYDLVTDPVLVAALASAVVVVETTLGAALLVDLKPRLVLAGTLLLLLVFLGVVGYAWATGVVEDCGCLPWKRSPAQAFDEDVLLVGAAAWAWWGHRYSRTRTREWKLVAVALAAGLGVALPAATGLSGAVAPGAAGVVGSGVFRSLAVDGLPADLATGTHLVLLMSTECTHCRESVPAVNALVADDRLPRLVALATEDEVERGLFREDYQARFQIGQISKQAMTSMVNEKFPRLFLVRNGVVERTWDGTVPTPDELAVSVGSTAK